MARNMELEQCFAKSKRGRARRVVACTGCEQGGASPQGACPSHRHDETGVAFPGARGNPLETTPEFKNSVIRFSQCPCPAKDNLREREMQQRESRQTVPFEQQKHDDAPHALGQSRPRPTWVPQAERDKQG